MSAIFKPRPLSDAERAAVDVLRDSALASAMSFQACAALADAVRWITHYQEEK